MPDAIMFINLGIGGMFLVLLFLGLARGQIYTEKSVEKLLKEKENRLEDKDAYIAKLEELNKKLDERNELFAGKLDQVIEISRAQGMIKALPPAVSERVVQ